MKAADLFKTSVREYRKSINPPYVKKDIIPILSTVFILIVIPLTVIAILNARGYQPRAAGQAVRGTSGDLWADVILGKRDFTEVSSGEILPYNAHKVGGVIVDRVNNRAYIFDGHNSRILGIDLTKCLGQTGACSADVVIGQPSASDYGACNRDSSFQNYPIRASATSSTLCGMWEGQLSTSEILPFVSMYVDSSGRLFVPDLENHRVLIYDNPWVTNAAADQVIGQADFSGDLCNGGQNNGRNPTASSLCFTDIGGHSSQHGAGVALDPSGNLWVADNGNNRVLRFSKDPANPGKFMTAADYVLGQTSFTVGPASWESGCSGMDKICNPTSLRFGPNGDLYVADAWNQRITVFAPPFNTNTIGKAAYKTFGTGGDTGMFHIGEVDPSGAGLWVNEYTKGKVVLWDWDGVTIKKTLILGATDSAGGIGIDSAGDVLPGLYSGGGNDVFVYNNPLANPNLTISSPSRSLFSPLPAGVPNGTNGSRLDAPTGVAVAAGQLFVTDLRRILYWNNPTSVVSGHQADGVLVKRNFSDQRGLMDGNGEYTGAFFGQIKADQDNRIWVRTQIDVRVYQAPVSIGDQPIKIISYPFNVLGGGQINSLFDVDSTGIVPTAHGEYLYFSESARNRVLRIKDPLGSNPVVDMVIGQQKLGDTDCNQGQTFTAGIDPSKNLLCNPGDLSIDRKSNLYVSDHSLETRGNWRLLMYSQASLPTTNTGVVFNLSATKSFPSANPPSHATWEPAFDSTNRMVVGVNPYSSAEPTTSRFVQYYDDPTNSSTVPTGYLKDFYSLPMGVTFDNQDNLYVADGQRSRVLIYKNPFNNTVTGTITPQPTIKTIIAEGTQGSDDAYKSCSLSLTTGDVRIGYDSGGFNCQPTSPTPITAGLRFPNLGIPRGATITNAVLSWMGGDTSNSNYLNLNIFGEAADNAATFSATNDPTTVTTTTASSNDEVKTTTPWKSGASYFSSKITTVVQEIVNRSGWASGNAMVFIIKNNGSALARRFPSWEGAYGANPSNIPELVVQYTTSAPTGKTGDLNGDNKVDIYDLSILLSNWGASGVAADINKDGVVNIFDLSILLSNWGS